MLASLACANSMCKMLSRLRCTPRTPGCQPPSDEGCCRDARSPGPRLTQGEVKTTPKASVTPHQQQPPTQPPQPRHTTLPRLRPRTWTWITPNAYLPRVCFGRRPAVRRKPHKSGQGPPGRGIAVRQFSPLRRREGPRAPAADHSPPPKNVPRFTVFCALRMFSAFFGACGFSWVNMGQDRPQDGPT